MSNYSLNISLTYINTLQFEHQRMILPFDSHKYTLDKAATFSKPPDFILKNNTMGITSCIFFISLETTALVKVMKAHMVLIP